MERPLAADLPCPLLPYTLYLCCRNADHSQAGGTRKGRPFSLPCGGNADEIKLIQERYGLTPIRHLQKLGVLDKRTVIVHAVWVDEEELEMLRDTGTKVSHNPESNMKLAVGVAPVPAMLRKGITVGLGTDGCASNNDLDLFREMGTAAKLHKVAAMDPTVLDARTALKMATIHGARVLGLGDQIGSIEPGKCADLILVDMNKPHLTPLYQVYSHLVYAASGTDVVATSLTENW